MKPGMKMIIMLVTAVSFWGGLFYFASCSGRETGGGNRRESLESNR